MNVPNGPDLLKIPNSLIEPVVRHHGIIVGNDNLNVFVNNCNIVNGRDTIMNNSLKNMAGLIKNVGTYNNKCK